MNICSMLLDQTFGIFLHRLGKDVDVIIPIKVNRSLLNPASGRDKVAE